MSKFVELVEFLEDNDIELESFIILLDILIFYIDDK